MDARGDFKRNRTLGTLAEPLFIKPSLCNNPCVVGISAAIGLKRLVRGAFAALAAIAVLAAPAAARSVPRIVAVGDLHGDYSAWLDIARNARLIDAGGHWTGGATTLVQLGDVTDRGADSLKIIRNLQQLEKEAPHAHGRVIIILGNHEAMNLLGDLRYTSPGEFAAFADGQSSDRRERAYQANKTAIEASYRAKDPKLSAAAIRESWIAETPLGWVEHRLAWQPNGELGRWASRNAAVARVGDTLFVHGGLSAEYSAFKLDQINKRVSDAMKSADDSPKSILTDPLGPLWYRGLIGPDPEADAVRATTPGPHPATGQELATVLSAFGVKRLVIAHTPNLSGIRITNGGRLARIDTGNSRYYGGTLSWLEIVGDRLTPHTVARSVP